MCVQSSGLSCFGFKDYNSAFCVVNSRLVVSSVTTVQYIVVSTITNVRTVSSV